LYIIHRIFILLTTIQSTAAGSNVVSNTCGNVYALLIIAVQVSYSSTVVVWLSGGDVRAAGRRLGGAAVRTTTMTTMTTTTTPDSEDATVSATCRTFDDANRDGGGIAPTGGRESGASAEASTHRCYIETVLAEPRMSLSARGRSRNNDDVKN